MLGPSKPTSKSNMAVFESIPYGKVQESPLATNLHIHTMAIQISILCKHQQTGEPLSADAGELQ